MNNSSQPFLYKNQNQEKCLLYCFSDHIVTLVYGNEYQLRPWKIKHKNFNTNIDSNILTPSNHNIYGDVILECNPHLINIENNRYLYYTAGFCKGHNEPIIYYLCRILANELSDSYLSAQNLEVLQNTFTGTYHNNHILYQQRNTNKSKLIINDSNNTEIDISSTQLIDILKINSIFNSDKLIITGQTLDNNMRSFIINSDYTIDKEILNNSGMPVYKCSIMDNELIYTVRHQDGSVIESRHLVLENY